MTVKTAENDYHSTRTPSRPAVRVSKKCLKSPYRPKASAQLHLILSGFLSDSLCSSNTLCSSWAFLRPTLGNIHALSCRKAQMSWRVMPSGWHALTNKDAYNMNTPF